jgi:GT2 family glycosyltransferase
MSASKSKLGVAITQWGHADLTIKLLNEIVSQSGVEQIVICDNGSDKAEVDLLLHYLKSVEGKAHFELECRITLVENSVNSGFSNGMNIAISELLKADADWIWLLNNDVSLSSNSLKKLRTAINSQQPGVYSSPMIEAGIGAFSGNFSYNLFTTRFKPIKSAFELGKTPQSRRYISGANMVIHRHVFDAVGLLNHRTFLYFEELDFTYRARAAGYQQGHIDGPMVEHQGAGSSEGSGMNTVRMYSETWSTLDFYKHHHKALFPCMLLVRTLVRCLTLLVSGRHNLIKAVFLATYDFLSNKNRHLATPKIKTISQFELSRKLS